MTMLFLLQILNFKIISILVLVFIILFPTSAYANHSDILGDEFIPKWVKFVANWWVQGVISDDEFMDAMEFLVEHKVIYIESDFSLFKVKDVFVVFIPKT